MTSSVNPAAFGQSVVFTATVQGAHGAVAGTVVFFDGPNGDWDGCVELIWHGFDFDGDADSGDAFDYCGYGATQNFAASTSEALSEVIQAAPTSVATTTMLASSANPAVSGQSVTFTVTVAAGASSKDSDGVGVDS